MAGFPSLRGRLERRLKTALAGTDLDTLVRNRDRRRLRWLAHESNDPVLRFRALRNLAEIIDPQSEEIFLERVQSSPGELPTTEIRTATEGLARLVCRKAAPALVRLLEPNRPATLNLAAARALSSLGSPADWQAVRRWVLRCDTQNPPFPDHRDLSINPDSSLPGATAALWVLQVLYPEKGQRWWSGKATAWLSSEDHAPRLGSERGADRVVAQSLRNSLQNNPLDDGEFRHHVLLLGNLSRDRDHVFLEQLGAAQNQATRRRDVQQAVSLCADLRGVVQMKQRLENTPGDDPEALTDALRCAGRFASRELVGPISGTWKKASTQPARSNLLWALGECGGGNAVNALVDLVRSRDEDLSDLDFQWISRSLQRCGNLGRQAVRGGLAIARAGGGERQRLTRLAELMGLS